MNEWHSLLNNTSFVSIFLSFLYHSRVFTGMTEPMEKVSMENFALLKVLGKGGMLSFYNHFHIYLMNSVDRFFSAYGKVFLVRKIGGSDHNTIYAMKVRFRIFSRWSINIKGTSENKSSFKAENIGTYSSWKTGFILLLNWSSGGGILKVLERLRGVPFLVQIYYAFQTDTKLHIVMGNKVFGYYGCESGL